MRKKPIDPMVMDDETAETRTEKEERDKRDKRDRKESSEVNKAFSERKFADKFCRIGRIFCTLDRIIAHMFMATKVHKESWMKFIHENIFFPAGFIIFRPTMNYTMSSLYLLKKGTNTGFTGFYNSLSNDGHDASTRIHSQYYYWTAGPVITNKKNVVEIPQAFSSGYLGGGHVDFYQDPTELTHRFDEKQNDLFAFLVPYKTTSDSNLANPLSITGEDPEMGLKNQFPGAKYYDKIWNFTGLNNSGRRTNMRNAFQSIDGFSPLCYRGYFIEFDPICMKYNVHHEGTGHWGPGTVYPGCSIIRQGLGKTYDSPKQKEDFRD